MVEGAEEEKGNAVEDENEAKDIVDNANTMNSNSRRLSRKSGNSLPGVVLLPDFSGLAK